MAQLQELGIECRAFTSNQTWEEQRQVYDDLRSEGLYVPLLFLTLESCLSIVLELRLDALGLRALRGFERAAVVLDS
ncbi:hypothetical protein, conserved [Eimeria tenella]|uniref:Uncharacterized protein n=1 Tax=Eimeria tenella TaxID=5802 RepID=U6L5P9_EIMTE|nr:hypothetical protein, conserved [Eimeria tenella]CDJ44518.1 hypothetical protein, conserved [Eimeria tenella]|eukprot:XP_013235266.1 hypothetical protein, conserved [Eimeria tenella]